MSSAEFSRQFLRKAEDLIAAQWQQLGVALTASGRESANSWIDLESLLAFTLFAPHGDRRLSEGALEWIIHHRGLVNTSRLKRLVTLYNRNRSTYRTQIGEDLMRDFSSGDTDRFANRVAEELGTSSYKPRGILSPLNTTRPRLLQLRLRSLFGINARAEVLMFLLQHKSENSNAMARHIGFAQKQVYLILENWTDAGIVRCIRQGRAGNYSLIRPDDWQCMLDISALPQPVNWIHAFHTLTQILDIIGETDDPYLLASRFRDIEPDLQRLLSTLEIHLPDARNFTGDAYLTPVADALLQAIDQLV